MINFISSWAEQIVLAVIVTTIIELILPNSKNKKYIQMVIGVYILFNIISPIINNQKVFSAFEEYGFDKYNSTNYQANHLDQTSMDKRLEKIYLEELEKNITSKFEEKGCAVTKCTIDAELNTTKKNAGIHLITVKIKSPVNEDELKEIKKEIIQEYEIDETKIQILIK